MRIGVDYYPEQWEQAMWEKDASQMASTGVKVVRMAEFAWSRLEPRENDFCFEWLDDALKVFERYNINVVLCTPTNCPPLWMYQKYPEIIKSGADGEKIQLGIRGHRCINSPVFRQYAKRITEMMIRRYSRNKNIIAWQIDNELESNFCTCHECRKKFRNWLIEKYDDVYGINEAFGNVVWSGEYSDISQVKPPTDYPKAWQNPALCLEWNRFASACTADYAGMLAQVIRKENPKIPITTNTWFCENTPDFYQLFEELDFVSYDNYPPINIPENPEEFYSHAFHLDLMRGIKESNFWIMEQLSGATGSWSPMSPMPEPGMLTGYSLQAIAHGADTVMHFRWRTALTGAEMHWHGLLDHSNIPNRRFFEFTELCKTVSKLDAIDGTKIVSDIAILYEPENNWAFEIQPQVEGFYYLEQLKYFHEAFTHFGANVDIVSPVSDLSNYKLVIAPSMYVNKKSATENIYRYVIGGGTVVLTCRSGVKDEHNNCIMEALPTVYKELIGADITEYNPIGNNRQTIKDFAGNEYECREWCDILQPNTARAYAEYNDSHYRCCPAVTLNRYCGGVAYYVGTVCNRDFYRSFVSNLMKQTGIPRLQGLADGVEVTTRTNGRDEYIFFFNNSKKDVVIPLPKAMYSILHSTGKDKLELKPFEMDIVRK